MKNRVSFFALFVGVVAVGAIIFGGVIKPIKESQTAAVINIGTGVTTGSISLVGRITPSNYCRALTSAYTAKGIAATAVATDISTICGSVTPITNASAYTINRYFTVPTYSKKSNTSFNYMVVIKNTSGATIRNFQISNLVPAGYTVNAAKSNYTTGTYSNGTFTLPKLGIVRNVIIYMNVTFPTATCDRITTVAPTTSTLKAYGVCSTRGATGTNDGARLGTGCSVTWSSAGGGSCTTGGCNDGPGSSYSVSAVEFQHIRNSCGGAMQTESEVSNCIAEGCAGLTTGGGSSEPVDNSEKGDSLGTGTSTGTGKVVPTR